MTLTINTNYFDRLIEIKNDPTKKLAVLGLGVENWQFVSWVVEVAGLKASQLILIDQRDTLVIPPQYSKLEKINQAEYVGGAGDLKWFVTNNAELVVKAPGIWSLKPELNTYREKHGADSIISSLTFFVERFRSSIIGVTGTKGKTTTCSLITHFLKDSKLNKQIEYCGNTTNISPYKFWTGLKDKLEDYIFVMELSSFQLQDFGMSHLSPKFSGITNYYIDHLDQHDNEEEYHSAKSNIFRYHKLGDTIILPDYIRDNQFLVSANPELINNPNYSIVCPNINDITNYKTNLRGEHNRSNIATALLLVKSVFESYGLGSELTPEYIQSKLNTFEPPKGRLELIKTFVKSGVNFNFYNDNTATEPDAVCACIKTLTQNADKLILIIAGKVKQGNYSKLVETLSSYKNSILVIHYCGQVGNKLQEMQNLISKQQSLKNLLISDWDYNKLIQDYNLKEGFNINIALSPGGSSLDEFANYIERGQLYLDWISNQK